MKFNNEITLAETFDSMSDIISEANANKISCGVKFLDDAVDGFYPQDFVVVAGRSGSGKTELVTDIAFNTAMKYRDKDVYYFALEAEDHEIGMRIIYKKLSSAYLNDESVKEKDQSISYDKWFSNQCNFLNSYKDQVAQDVLSTNLKIVYGGENYTIEDFKRDISGVTNKNTSLVIVDLLQYFSIGSENENQALFAIIKSLREILKSKKIPLVLVSHIRKMEKGEKLIPAQEDLHGTSNIAKVSTKVIMISSSKDFRINSTRAARLRNGLGTFIGIEKNRRNGSVTRYVAYIKFNSLTNHYYSDYVLGYQKQDRSETIFQELPEEKVPMWASSEVMNSKELV